MQFWFNSSRRSCSLFPVQLNSNTRDSSACISNVFKRSSNATKQRHGFKLHQHQTNQLTRISHPTDAFFFLSAPPSFVKSISRQPLLKITLRAKSRQKQIHFMYTLMRTSSSIHSRSSVLRKSFLHSNSTSPFMDFSTLRFRVFSSHTFNFASSTAPSTTQLNHATD
jgi:hypothetical protein